MISPIELKALQQTGDIEISPKKQELQAEKPSGSFTDMLSKAVNSVDQTIKASDQKVEDFVAGKTQNVHDVMISMQRAQLSFQLMVEVRNKAIETYREISLMQI